MPADFDPTLEPTKNIGAFKFWCQTALPAVYDESLSYYELLCKVVATLNEIITNNNAQNSNVESLLTAYQQLQTYVNDYFENLDIQDEINNKLDDMASDGTLTTILQPTISQEVTTWLGEHITQPDTAIALDDTFTVATAAAQSAAVGEKAFIAGRATLANGGDANNATDPGTYYKPAANNVTNLPDQTTGMLLVLTPTGATSIMQIFFTAGNEQYVRYKSSGGWGEWSNLVAPANSELMLSREQPEITEGAYFNAVVPTGVSVIPSNSAATGFPPAETGKPACVIGISPESGFSTQFQLYLTQDGNLYARRTGSSWTMVNPRNPNFYRTFVSTLTNESDTDTLTDVGGYQKPASVSPANYPTDTSSILMTIYGSPLYQMAINLREQMFLTYQSKNNWNMVCNSNDWDNRLYKKSLFVLGDSLSTNNFSTSWCTQLSTAAYMTLTNNSISGSAIANSADDPDPSFVSRIDDAVDGLTSCDYCVVYGGSNDQVNSTPIGENDSNSQTEFKGALNYIANAVLTKFPQCKMLFICQPYRLTRADNDLGLNDIDYVKAMEEWCNYRGFAFYNNFYKLPINRNNASCETWAWSDDGTHHLSTAGNKLCAQIYYKVLESL